MRSLVDQRQCDVCVDPFVVGRGQGVDFSLDPFGEEAPSREFAIRRVPGGYELDPQAEVTLNGLSVRVPTAIRSGDRIAVGDAILAFEIPLRRDNQTRLGGLLPHQPYGSTIEVPAGMKVILGRESSLQVYWLDHPQISRRHAEVVRTTRRTTLRDLSSSNGTYLNGRRIAGETPLAIGDFVGLGPFTFSWSGEHLSPIKPNAPSPQGAAPQVELACYGLTCSITATGRPLLREISLRIAPGEFACILGPSGAGKSTLLRALANRLPSGTTRSGGTVAINGEDLYQHFDRLKPRIAFVPQHEILFDDLTLETALRYTARLRLPPDFSRAEIDRRVDEVLQTVRLGECRGTRIGHLSGGQRKRASLANEIVASPDLLFLDEVTSGLDEMTDSEMMRLFRQVADEGRTVVCVTHSLNYVPRDCTRVICLTRFGYLAFDGTPDQALAHFGISQIGQVYQQLAVGTEAEADTLAEKFTQRRAKHTSVRPQADHGAAKLLPPCLTSELRHEVAVALRQTVILLQRTTGRAMLDGRSNLLRLVQCLIVAVLLYSVFGDVRPSPQDQLFCSFILLLSSFWFGCNNSAKEIVRERDIFEQERSVVVRELPYWLSKLIMLTAVSAGQAVALAQVASHFCNLPGSPWAWSLLGGAMALAGVGIGLAISGTAQSEEAAIAAVPIVLIPQIILAGALTDLQGLNEVVAQTVVASYSGLDLAQAILELPPIEAGPEYSARPIPWSSLWILGLQTVLALAVVRLSLGRSLR